MAAKTEEKPKDGAAAEAAPKSKKPLKLIVGAVVVLALGAVAAVMAVPGAPPPKPQLQGPFAARLSKEDLQVNLSGENGKRYLVLSLNAEYFAYDERYVAARFGQEEGGEAGAEDALFSARLKDAMLRIAARRTREQVEDPVQMEAFLMEVRNAVDPLLFPVCVGDSIAPQIADKKSGLRVGESVMDSTLRGLLHDHVLKIDGKRKIMVLDDGPETPFKGDERDLRVNDAKGDTVYLNLAGLKPDFSGEVQIGVPGRLRRIYRDQILVQ